MKKLTEQTLKDLIRQVYLDAFEDICSDEPALLAEPTEQFQDPPMTEGNQSVMPRLIKLLNGLTDDERSRIFRRFGYYTSAHLLQQLNSIKKAEKGSL